MANLKKLEIIFDLETFRTVGISHPENLRLAQAIIHDALMTVQIRRHKAESEEIEEKGNEKKIIPFKGKLPPHPGGNA